MFVSAWEEDNTGIEAKNLEDPIETFLTAAEEGNGEKVRELLESDPSLIKVRPFFQNFSLKNVALSVFYWNFSSLISYCRFFNLSNKYFLKISFFQAFDRDGYTALHRAAYNNHLPVVDYLLTHGADPEAR